MTSQSVLALEPGTIFGDRYRVARCLNAGNMGAVYEVFDIRTDTRRALKIMLPGANADQDLRLRFEREARVTGAVESEHIVRVLDAGVERETATPFLVMELLRGEDLGGVARREGALAPDVVVAYLYQVSLALDKAHAAGVVHRDIKPDNLFLTRRDDGSPYIKILDFGIAKVVAQGPVGGTRPIGTPLYMSPEQMAGDPNIGPAADIFALAHVAFTLLVGEAYWAKDAADAEAVLPFLTKIMEGVREPPTVRARARAGVDLPPSFDAWFYRATARSPAARFERATAAVAALAEALDVAPPRASALPPAGIERAPRGRASNPSVASRPSGPGMTVPLSGSAPSSRPGGPVSVNGPPDSGVAAHTSGAVNADSSAPRSGPAAPPYPSGGVEGTPLGGLVGSGPARRPSRIPVAVGSILLAAIAAGGAVFYRAPAAPDFAAADAPGTAPVGLGSVSAPPAPLVIAASASAATATSMAMITATATPAPSLSTPARASAASSTAPPSRSKSSLPRSTPPPPKPPRPQPAEKHEGVY